MNMRYWILLLAVGLISTAFSPFFNNPTLLEGKVNDLRTGEALNGASIVITQEAKVIATLKTDKNGQFSLKIEPGTYVLTCTQPGYTGHRYLGVTVKDKEKNTVNFVLAPDAELEEMTVSDFSQRPEATTMGEVAVTSAAPRSRDRATMKSESILREAPRSTAKPAPAPLTEGAVLYDKKKPATTEEEIASGDEISPAEGKIHGAAPTPRAGLLTAGEWNDLHNWNKHWLDLLADGEIADHQKTYGFYPKHRYTVLLSNPQGLPVSDQPVALYSGNTLLWEARTDNTGKAELWAGLFDGKAADQLQVRCNYQGQALEWRNLKEAKAGMNTWQLPAPCGASKNVDIVWAVDATGSMGDEIEYLKTELLDVIGRVKTLNPELAIRMGTVFYRDNGDDYLTKSSNLNADASKTVGFIRKQFAGGGGDYPEAVHSALEEAIFRQSWSQDAVARICFLVLDASPHQTPEVNASLQRSIREAARFGIRIVPVTASGIQKDTEFLMKFFGLATNGTYVFLTDHSGIGGKHLEPTTDEYKVELLNDLLVRLIGEYTATENCKGQSEIRFETQQQQQTNAPELKALYYPNPASVQFTLELPVEVQSVTLYDAEGKAVRKLESVSAGKHQVEVQDLPPGFYTIRILSKGRMQSGKIMVLRS